MTTKAPKRESIIMSVAEWHLVPSNPRQRDTERHLRRAKHLLNPSPAQSRVTMAVTPDGRRFKIDGHSRDLLWSRNQGHPPKELYVDVIPVRDEDAAADLYRHYDSLGAVETAGDQVTGAFAECGYLPKSKLIKQASIANAVRVADGLWSGNRMATRDDDKGNNVYTIIERWLPYIKDLDELNPSRAKFSGPVITACLMTFRKYGHEAREFWRLYLDDGGQKFENAMDAVEAFTRFMMQAVVYAEGPLDVVGKALNAFEGHRDNKTYTGGLKSRDPTTFSKKASTEGLPESVARSLTKKRA